MIGGSLSLRFGFVALTLLLMAAFVGAVRWVGLRAGHGPARVRRDTVFAAAGAFAWVLVTGGAAATGLLRFSPPPPTMLALFVAIVALVLAIGASALGRRLAFELPLAALIGYQGFRIVVELLLHRAYVEGLNPVQMTYSGSNFDILTGVSAVVLGIVLAIRPLPTWALLGWNLLGLGLLLNVVTIALLSAPTPFRRFQNEPANVWVTHAPWVCLPAVMVLAALLGHVLLFRRLLGKPAGRAQPMDNERRTVPPSVTARR